jgi:hypothetical protein
MRVSMAPTKESVNLMAAIKSWRGQATRSLSVCWQQSSLGSAKQSSLGAAKQLGVCQFVGSNQVLARPSNEVLARSSN